jgi:hypothetical protein
MSRLRWRILGSWRRDWQLKELKGSTVQRQNCKIGVSHYGYHLAPRPLAALARPLPRVPRRPPRAAPPLPAAAPPRLGAPAIREAGAGVENLGVAFEDVGGFSTKDVSVVLQPLAMIPLQILQWHTRMLSLHLSRREIYPNSWTVLSKC